MYTLMINGDAKQLISTLFKLDDDGYIKFGMFGKSTKQNSLTGLANDPIEFKDYLMEGYVRKNRVSSLFVASCRI